MNEPSKAEDRYSKNIASAMMLSYIVGVKFQMARLKKLHSTKTLAPPQTLLITHEISSILESLDCIRHYEKVIGVDDKLNESIKTMRHHIRHDLREGLKADSELKKDRSSKLGLPDIAISWTTFNGDTIKIGESRLTYGELNRYLKRARTMVMNHLTFPAESHEIIAPLNDEIYQRLG